jgi:hypothetical protein
VNSLYAYAVGHKANVLFESIQTSQQSLQIQHNGVALDCFNSRVQCVRHIVQHSRIVCVGQFVRKQWHDKRTRRTQIDDQLTL